MNLQHKQILQQYFPEETIEQVASMLKKHAVQLKITRERVSKLGDYRPPVKQHSHRITVNGNLGKELLYLVFLHEMAHLLIWIKYGRRVSPHGAQWKQEFGSMLRHAVYMGYIPENLKQPVEAFAGNVKATFAADSLLWKSLKSMDGRLAEEITVEDIPTDTFFRATNGRLFKKEEKLRKRYRCFCLNNNRRYLFHPMAVIEPVKKEDIHNSNLKVYN